MKDERLTKEEYERLYEHLDRGGFWPPENVRPLLSSLQSTEAEVERLTVKLALATRLLVSEGKCVHCGRNMAMGHREDSTCEAAKL